MKNILLMTLSILIASLNYGQDKKWEIGGQLGFNMSTTSGKYSANDNTKNKWIGTPSIGAEAAYRFTPLIAIVGGLFMIKTGALYLNSYVGEDGVTYEWKQRERFTTIRLPVMARFMWGATWQYYGMIGFYITKRLCGKYVFEDPSSDFEQTGKIKFGEEPENYSGDDWYLEPKDFRRWDVGLSVGAGVRRALGPGFLSFNILFGMGLCDFYEWDNKSDQQDGYKKTSDRNLNFQFGYTYPIGPAL